MNTTTKEQRSEWIRAAYALIELDEDSRATNWDAITDYIIARYGCSRGSALTAVANATRRKRYNDAHPESAAAAALGSMTSNRKAAASRRNGRKGGRPRKDAASAATGGA